MKKTNSTSIEAQGTAIAILSGKDDDPEATAEEFSVVQKEGKREVSRAVTCYGRA